MNAVKLTKKEKRLLLDDVEWATSLFVLNELLTLETRFRNTVGIYIKEALMFSFLVRVARIFDTSYMQKNLTVFALLPEKHFSASEFKTMERIKECRNKYLAHNDKKTATSFSKSDLFEEMEPEDIVKLLQKSCGLLKEGYDAKQFSERKKSVFQECLKQFS